MDDLPNKLLSHGPYLKLYFQKNAQLRSDSVRVQMEAASMLLTRVGCLFKAAACGAAHMGY